MAGMNMNVHGLQVDRDGNVLSPFLAGVRAMLKFDSPASRLPGGGTLGLAEGPGIFSAERHRPEQRGTTT